MVTLFTACQEEFILIINGSNAAILRLRAPYEKKRAKTSGSVEKKLLH
jgi:hypothetical protein